MACDAGTVLVESLDVVHTLSEGIIVILGFYGSDWSFLVLFVANVTVDVLNNLQRRIYTFLIIYKIHRLLIIPLNAILISSKLYHHLFVVVNDILIDSIYVILVHLPIMYHIIFNLE